MPISSLKKKNQKLNLPHVAWHQWSVVRLAAIALATVLTGYLTAAVLAVKSIDYLLHIAHDPAIESAITLSLESQKDSYKNRQDLLLEKIQHLAKNPTMISNEQMTTYLNQAGIDKIFRDNPWEISTVTSGKNKRTYWANRSELIIGNKSVRLIGTRDEEQYRITEDVLKRYKIIGFELRERIRPALIRALTITLAVMCTLLMIAFTYMTLRSKTRVEKIVQGFIRYAHGDDAFRFKVHGHNELGLLSRQFNHMADEVAENRSRTIGLEKLASWQTIARKMAHEIKNPLTPIQIMISQLHRNYTGQDQDYSKLLAKAHNVILEEVSSLRRMVDDFSQFAQLPSPRMTMTNAVTCAKQVVQLAEDTYKPHTIRYEGPDGSVIADLDDQLIRQALHNLIKNAAEADPSASDPIILRLQHTPVSIIFEVEDYGPGIPQDIRQNIFEAYVTTKHTGPTPGMGLGLAICQKIVLEHGGKIELDSSPGKTIFRLIIPKAHKGIPFET